METAKHTGRAKNICGYVCFAPLATSFLISRNSLSLKLSLLVLLKKIWTLYFVRPIFFEKMFSVVLVLMVLSVHLLKSSCMGIVLSVFEMATKNRLYLAEYKR